MKVGFKDLSGFLKTSVVLLWVLVILYALGVISYAVGVRAV